MPTVTAREFFQPQTHIIQLPGMQVKTLNLTPELSVSVAESNIRQQFLAVTEAPERARFHFSCQLHGSTRVTHARRRFELDPQHVLASCLPGAGFQLDCSPGWRNLELRINAPALRALAGDDAGLHRLDSGPHDGLLLNPGNLHIRDAALRLMQQITAARPSTLLVHSAALEFIAWHLKNLHAHGSEPRICARESRRLWQAREVLLSDLSCPPPLEQLARETGLNLLKLKRGFKLLFGSTAYGLFQRERMQHARVLLQTHNVTETASLLGYSNISHFSNAFRKQFGVLPRAARRGVLGDGV